MEKISYTETAHCFPLSKLKIGESGFVKKIETESSMLRRLLDLGMTDGIKVTCLMSAPSGDPREYLIRGTIIGLRNQDAEKVFMSNN